MIKVTLLSLSLLFLVGCNSAESVTAGGGAPVVGDAPAPVPSAAPLPAGNSVIVEGGAESTRDLFVSLTLASVGATEMAVYPNADCSGPVAWRPYGATLPWVLHQANNDVFVSAKFRNEALAESPCVFDSIRHDDQAAAAPGITSPHNGATVEERSLSYSGSCATEAGAVTTASPGPGAAVSALSCAAGVLSATVSFTPVSGEVARTVTFQTADAAGNAASLVHAVYLKEPVGFAENVMGGGVNNAVNALALQPDGKIIAAGAFTTKRLARFLADGTPDVDFSAAIGTGANGEIQSLAVLTDGKILIGGAFTQFSGVTVPRLAKLSASGVLDTAFITAVDAGPSGGSPAVQALAVLSDGKILVGGPFSKWNGLPAGFNSGIHRLNASGSYDSSFVLPGAVSVTSGQYYQFLPQAGGKVLVGARRETTVNGHYTGGLFRVISTGALDFTGGFAPTTTTRLLQSGAFVRALLSDMNGGVMVGGSFTQYGDDAGVARTVGRMVRINAVTGAYDAAFSAAVGAGFNGEVNALALQDDGKILVGGAFTSFNGHAVGRLLRLNPDGSFDDAFTAALQPNAGSMGFNSTVRALLPDGVGRLLLGGSFTALNSLNIGRILRLY